MNTKKNKSTNEWELSKITSSGKKVKVHSGAKRSDRKNTETLHNKILNQEFDNMERISKWHSVKEPKKKTESSSSTKIPKIKGFKKSSDGQIIAIKK